MTKQNEKDAKRVPELRFKGFTDDWEQRKLGEIGSFRSGVGFPESEQGGMTGVPFYKVSDMNLSENNTVMNISSNYVTDDQISRNKWKPIDGNTIIFAKVGAAVFLERKRQTRCKFLIDNNMMSYKPNSIQDHDYIYYTFQNLNLSHYAQIGSLPSLNAGELKNVNIVLPEQNEQSKVSQLFLNLDKTITLHEEKHRQLELLKKALLQKMFADKTGYPALRFKEFSDAWKQRMLGDISLVRTGYAFKSSDFSKTGQYKIVTNKEFSNSSLSKNMKADRINISDKTLLSKYELSGQNILVTMDGVNIGKASLFSDSSAVLAQRVGRINSTQLDFIFSVINNSDFVNTMRSLAVGNAIKHISLRQISSYVFRSPISIKEQKLIGELFKNLDNLIALHQHKIDNLKRLKRALLQKMFV